MSRYLILWALAAVVACGRTVDRDDPDAGVVPPRVFRPRPGRVRALPPHNILNDGIGPYRVGAAMRDVFIRIPDRPRIEVLHLEGLFDHRLLRAERGGLLIGSLRGKSVRFITAIGPEIAHTGAGRVIGRPAAQLSKELGEPVGDGRVRDPRIHVFSKFPGVRFIAHGAKVQAVLVASSPRAAKVQDGEGGADSEGQPCDPESNIRPNAVSAGRAGLDAEHVLAVSPQLRAHKGMGVGGAHVTPYVVWGCMAPGQPMAIASKGNALTVVTIANGRASRVASATIVGLVYAAPLDADGDGDDEVLAVERIDSASEVRYRIRVLEPNLNPIVSRDVFTLKARAVKWVGASRLSDTELYLEAWRSAGALRVGGVYIQRDGGVIRNVVPLDPVKARVRGPRKPASPPRPPPAPKRPDAGPRADANP